MAKIKKGILTQGTSVWMKHGDTPLLTKLECITSITLGDDSPTDIPTTCLEETDSATSMYGLNTPGEGSIVINTDPKNASHIVILGLADDLAGVEVYVGLSDGTTEPSLATSTVTLPTDRSWVSFTALLKNSSPTLEPDSLVQHTISMKRQSKAVTTWKTT